jgi:hypothetical protein
MAAERHLILDDTGFSIKGERYVYSVIDGLYFYRVQVQKTVNIFAPAGIDHKSDLKIYVQKIAKPLIVRAGVRHVTVMGLNFGKNSSERLAAKYAELSQRSFKQRLDKYAGMLEKYGYFLYDDAKIHADGLVQGSGWSFNLKTDRPIMRVPFAIFHERKGTGFLGGSKRYALDTTIDADVFFTILHKLFGLHW